MRGEEEEKKRMEEGRRGGERRRAQARGSEKNGEAPKRRRWSGRNQAIRQSSNPAMEWAVGARGRRGVRGERSGAGAQRAGFSSIGLSTWVPSVDRREFPRHCAAAGGRGGQPVKRGAMGPGSVITGAPGGGEAGVCGP